MERVCMLWGHVYGWEYCIMQNSDKITKQRKWIYYYDGDYNTLPTGYIAEVRLIVLDLAVN